MSLRFSIVVNTYNRAASLAVTLRAFDFLRYPDFEVIVVNGPSTDDTAALLERHAGRIKIGHCPETNLAQSRNIGIGLAAGDVVCFIDDDGIPEPGWLDALARAYLADPRTGAAGGFVRDHTGVDYQCRYIVCNRYGDASFHETAEGAEQACASDPGHYYSLIGVNSSFRREALLQIGGFDEEYAYFLDETDVCARLVAAGWKVRFVPDAEVHHKFAPSHLRSEKKIPVSLYYTARSKVYFAFRNAVPQADSGPLFTQAAQVRAQMRRDVDHLRRFGQIGDERHASLCADVERGFREGIADAHAWPAGRPMPASALVDTPFRPFVTPLPPARRQQLILISQDYPPRACGGIGVFMHRLAEALAAAGHEISVITRSTGRHTVDLENGVWVHRVPLVEHGARAHVGLPDLPQVIRNHALTVYDEAMRIQAQRGAAVTLSAIWDLEAAACVASAAFTNFVYLVTTYQLSLPDKPEWQRDAHYREHHVGKMIAGERWLLASSARVIASTRGIRDDVLTLNPEVHRAQPVPVIPFGLPAAGALPPRPADYPDDAIVVLFVGRFEARKGVDLLLDVIPALLERHPRLHFRLAGDDRIVVDGETYKAAFLARHRARTDLLARIDFRGFVDDAALEAEYAHCDVFVAPSRYESFGLIYLEAMRWGKPCIGTRIGGIPEVVGDDCALLAEAGDAGSLAQALDTLVATPSLRQRHGEAGRRRFDTHYSIDAFCTHLLDAMALPDTMPASAPAATPDAHGAPPATHGTAVRGQQESVAVG